MKSRLNMLRKRRIASSVRKNSPPRRFPLNLKFRSPPYKSPRYRSPPYNARRSRTRRRRVLGSPLKSPFKSRFINKFVIQPTLQKRQVPVKLQTIQVPVKLQTIQQKSALSTTTKKPCGSVYCQKGEKCVSGKCKVLHVQVGSVNVNEVENLGLGKEYWQTRDEHENAIHEVSSVNTDDNSSRA